MYVDQLVCVVGWSVGTPQLSRPYLAFCVVPTVAGKLTREVKGWWTKLEKVITYRQKVIYDKSRQQAMNRQLVTLVKQTERYTESLAHDDDDDDNEN